MKQLFGYCPSLTNTPCQFGERDLAAITALGLFGLRTQLKVSMHIRMYVHVFVGLILITSCIACLLLPVLHAYYFLFSFVIHVLHTPTHHPV